MIIITFTIKAVAFICHVFIRFINDFNYQIGQL